MSANGNDPDRDRFCPLCSALLCFAVPCPALQLVLISRIPLTGRSSPSLSRFPLFPCRRLDSPRLAGPEYFFLSLIAIIVILVEPAAGSRRQVLSHVEMGLVPLTLLHLIVRCYVK